MNKKEVFEKSIVLLGPVGVGKSFLSEQLGKKYGLPVVCLDLMRHCPTRLSDITLKKLRLLQKASGLKKQLELCLVDKDIEALKEKLKETNALIWNCEQEYKTRELFPKLPNYEIMGFNGDISNYIRVNFGVGGWFFYQKQFENQLLQALVEQIETPCIIDMGGGMAVSPQGMMRGFDKLFREVNEEVYLKNMNTSMLSFSIIEDSLKPFKNVIGLKLPQDYKKNMKKASDNRDFNDLLIPSGQYDLLSKKNISVDGLIEGEKINKEKMSEIIESIDLFYKQKDIEVE